MADLTAGRDDGLPQNFEADFSAQKIRDVALLAAVVDFGEQAADLGHASVRLNLDFLNLSLKKGDAAAWSVETKQQEV